MNIETKEAILTDTGDSHVEITDKNTGIKARIGHATLSMVLVSLVSASQQGRRDELADMTERLVPAA